MSDNFDDFPLSQSEELDSDEIRNNDGDAVTDPPERWIPPKDDETLDERLAEEVPDVVPDDTDDEPNETHDANAGGGLAVVGDDELDNIDPDRHGSDEGQIDGTPEDGESFFEIVE